MDNPIITYSVRVKDENKYSETHKFYCGTCTRKSPLDVDVRIWNNKYGTEEVMPLKDFALNLYFGCEEDAVLLPFLKVIYNKTGEANLDLIDGTLTVTFWEDIVLSGAPNNGEEADRGNYLDLNIKLEVPDGMVLRYMDLKSIYLEIVQQ